MWVGMSLINASTLLLVLRHFCYVGRHVSYQYFGTPASDTILLLHGQARDVLYCTVPIVLCPSHSLFSIYACICLYVVHPNNMTYANIYLLRI